MEAGGAAMADLFWFTMAWTNHIFAGLAGCERHLNRLMIGHAHPKAYRTAASGSWKSCSTPYLTLPEVG
jgi:hypothetical protein